jgi:hypothetical protein
MKNPVKAYFDCECDNDLFRVWNDENWIEIAIFERPKSISFLTRLRYIWRIIRYGEPYNDQIVMNKDEFNRFRDYLNGIILESEK